MEQYKIDFIKFMIDSNVLTFGDFTTKSGNLATSQLVFFAKQTKI